MQALFCLFNMFLLVGWYVLYFVIAQMLGDKAWGVVEFRPTWSAVFPAIAIICYYLARRGILADEKLVRSIDRIREKIKREIYKKASQVARLSFYLFFSAAMLSFRAAIFSSESLCFLRSRATTASGALATKLSLESFFFTPARKPSRCCS